MTARIPAPRSTGCAGEALSFFKRAALLLPLVACTPMMSEPTGQYVQAAEQVLADTCVRIPALDDLDERVTGCPQMPQGALGWAHDAAP
jgi:hypothetical protein